MNSAQTQIPSYSGPKTRTLEVALDLFSQHGVAGTSLQMIADAVGVTKAAIYHQFNTKDEIVIGSAWLIFDNLAATVTRASQSSSLAATRELVVNDLIDLAVDSRGFAGFLQRDPIMLRYFQEYQPFSQILADLSKLLMANDTRQKSRVTVAMILTGIGSAVLHPLVADMSDKALRTHLKKLVQSMIAGLD